MVDARTEFTRNPRRFTALLGFLRSESAGGVALISTALVALAWSNSPSPESYHHLLELPISIGVGSSTLAMSFERWVNDGLMTLFFLVVGLEIRREMTDGQLASVRQVAAPGLAALGGMIVPAIIFAALNWDDPTKLHGWAVPVATDIAFALAAISVLGRRVPTGLKVFLTAVAIIDDLGAIIVIAVFYTASLAWVALLAALAVAAVIYAMNRLNVKAMPPYLIGGLLLWLCVLNSGIHATLAGVMLAFVVPLGPEPDCVGHRIETRLSGWVTWAVLPLFGLANAGLQFGDFSMGDLGGTLILGTVLGLVVGKQLGVFGATLLALRLGLARLPSGVSYLHLYGGAVLCGIGFTMSLFIADLSFRGSHHHEEAISRRSPSPAHAHSLERT